VERRDGGAVLVWHHDRGREVVAEEQLVLGAEQVVLAVPPGRGFPRLAVTFVGLVTIGRRIADPASGDPRRRET